MANPKISIVIPSYNKRDYIEATLKSIVIQKYPNLEVFIQDGGSTDGSIEIIKKFALKYPFFKWVSQKDGGQLDAINSGLCKTSGELLTFINADDVYSKGAFFKIAQAYRENPGCLWISGFGNIINSSGAIIQPWVTKYKNALIILNKYPLLLAVNYITQPATFMTKKSFQKFGPFTGNKRYIMEYDLWLRMGKVQMPTIIKENLASFRLTTDNISATYFKELLNFDYQIASQNTNNSLLLLVHKAHNLGRVGLISLFKQIG